MLEYSSEALNFQCAISVMMRVSIYQWIYLASNQHSCLQFCYVCEHGEHSNRKG